MLVMAVCCDAFMNSWHPHAHSLCNTDSLMHNYNNNIMRLYGGLDQIPMELDEDNAKIVIDEVRAELGTIFGYDKGSRDAGITGEIELVEIDGPILRIALRGRFWHATDTVMMRVQSYCMQRIPELIDVELDMEASDIIDDNRLNTGKLY